MPKGRVESLPTVFAIISTVEKVKTRTHSRDAIPRQGCFIERRAICERLEAVQGCSVEIKPLIPPGPENWRRARSGLLSVSFEYLLGAKTCQFNLQRFSPEQLIGHLLSKSPNRSDVQKDG